MLYIVFHVEHIIKIPPFGAVFFIGIMGVIYFLPIIPIALITPIYPSIYQTLSA